MVLHYPKPSEGALDSVTLEQIRDGIEAAGVPIREARITLNDTSGLRNDSLRERLRCPSIREIDGRIIGKPRGRLYQVLIMRGRIDCKQLG